MNGEEEKEAELLKRRGGEGRGEGGEGEMTEGTKNSEAGSQSLQASPTPHCGAWHALQKSLVCLFLSLAEIIKSIGM